MIERRIHTTKLKQHIKHLVTATTTLLTATTISITAFAELTWGHGVGGGATSAPRPSNQLYNMTTTDELSWKVDLYVSASETGKVDPLADTIGSANLPWVGSVLYDNWFNTWEGSAGNVYVQTNYTNNRTGLTPAYITPIVYGGYTQGYKVGNCLPCVYTLQSGTPYYPINDGSGFASNMTVYHSTSDCGLPSEMEKITTYTYKSLVQSKVESTTFMENVLIDIDSGLQSSGSSLYSRVKSLVKTSSGVATKMNALISSGADDKTITNALLPTNPDCVVEWVAVVVPMVAWSETSGSGTYDYSCWEINNGVGGINIVGGNSSYSNRLGLDSFMSAQLNLTTKTIFRDRRLASFYSEYVTITESMATGYADRGKLRYGISNGSVYAEKYYENIASCAHDLHDSETYCGVYTSNSVTSWTDGNMAKYGGITVYKNDIDEPDTAIPVYYYITPDPNNPITPPSTATPPTFTPTPPPGTTVTRVAIPSDNSLTEPDSPPDDFPDPVATPYKELLPTGDTYPIDPDNPPDHILVECKETDDIPIYYHIFTFYNTTGEIYADVFDYLTYNPKETEPTSEQIIASLPVR